MERSDIRDGLPRISLRSMRATIAKASPMASPPPLLFTPLRLREVAREALADPYWPRHAARALGAEGFADWPHQYGWWLDRREATFRRMRGET
jgi:hypothetical protein